MRLLTSLLFSLFLFPLNATATGDFTTEATVRYVMACMAENGGMSDENFYYCTCRHDALVQEISFSDYEEGITYERNKPMPGEKGAVFRGIKRGQEKYEQLQEARKVVDTQCTLTKRVARPPSSQ